MCAHRLALFLRKKEGTVMDVVSLVWRDEWKMGCLKSPLWESECEARAEDEGVSSSGSREGNMCNDALHVIGLHGPGGNISLFLQDWELAKWH